MTFINQFLLETHRTNAADFDLEAYRRWREEKQSAFRLQFDITDREMTTAEYRDFRAWVIGSMDEIGD